MATPQLDNWKAALAQQVGVPLTPQVSHFFDLWSRAEGGGATNNPFNTTQPGYGSAGNYNSVGVKNYSDPMGGIQATAATLKNGRYGNILQAMRSGDVHAMAQALYNSPWGTGALVLKMLGASPMPQGQTPGIPPPAPPQTPGGQQQAPQVLMPTKLDQLVNDAAPSAFGVSLLGRLGGTAGRIAQEEQARIPFAQKLQPMPGFSPQPGQGAQPSPLPQGGSDPFSGPAGKFKPNDPVLNGTSVSSEHATMGLDGFPAHDYFAPAGSRVAAPVSGKVYKLSGHDPSQGPTQGPHGPLGWSVYILGSDGRRYYLTHMGSRDVKVGQKIKAGQVIGTVANYDKYGTPSHIHMGVSG